jgi:hypothetical protein
MPKNKVVGKNKRKGSNKATGRDYSYDKEYQSSEKRKKYRAELNAYNRKKGTYGNGDGLDASHKGGVISGFESAKVNRARKPKRRK